MSHFNVSDLKIENLTNFVVLFPFLISVSYYYHFLWLTRSGDKVMQRAYWSHLWLRNFNLFIHCNVTRVWSYLNCLFNAWNNLESCTPMMQSINLTLRKDWVFNMWRAWDKEKIRVPRGNWTRDVTFRAPVGHSNHWATGDSWRA